MPSTVPQQPVYFSRLFSVQFFVIIGQEYGILSLSTKVFLSRSFFFILVNMNFLNVCWRLLHCLRTEATLQHREFATLVKTISHLAAHTRQNRNDVCACAIRIDTVQHTSGKFRMGWGRACIKCQDWGPRKKLHISQISFHLYRAANAIAMACHFVTYSS